MQGVFDPRTAASIVCTLAARLFRRRRAVYARPLRDPCRGAAGYAPRRRGRHRPISEADPEACGPARSPARQTLFFTAPHRPFTCATCARCLPRPACSPAELHGGKVLLRNHANGHSNVWPPHRPGTCSKPPSSVAATRPCIAKPKRATVCRSRRCALIPALAFSATVGLQRPLPRAAHIRRSTWTFLPRHGLGGVFFRRNTRKIQEHAPNCLTASRLMAPRVSTPHGCVPALTSRANVIQNPISKSRAASAGARNRQCGVPLYHGGSGVLTIGDGPSASVAPEGSSPWRPAPGPLSTLWLVTPPPRRDH